MVADLVWIFQPTKYVLQQLAKDFDRMMSVIDPGHKYLLLTLDGPPGQTLTFVKRMDEKDPSKYPGNTSAYPGTTIQSVVRCLIERVDYLQNQIAHKNNVAIRRKFLEILWLLEDRAAERHGRDFDYRPEDMDQMPMCSHCGHVVCNQLGNTKK